MKKTFQNWSNSETVSELVKLYNKQIFEEKKSYEKYSMVIIKQIQN
ncbi:hypothetical protein [Spiroplasma diminutum]|nr:hypothetical protein [Spiroplasma diminutum]